MLLLIKLKEREDYSFIEVLYSKLNTILYQRGQTKATGLARGVAGEKCAMQELRQITPEHFWPSALAAKQLTKELVCRPATLGMPSFREGFGVLSFFFVLLETFFYAQSDFSPKISSI